MAEDLSIYFYDPSLGAAILFTVLYTPPFLWHLWCVAVAPRTRGYARTLYYIPMVIGAAFEVIGYAVRCGSTRSPNDVGLYASSATFIVLAPVFICASLYMLIARPVPSTTDDELSGQDDAEGEKEQQKLRILWIKPRWLPRLFVGSDIFSLLLQSSGSVIALSNDWEGEKKDIGLAILITGLVLQAVTVTLFLVIVLTARRRAIAARKYNLGLKMVIRGVVIGVCLILVRLGSSILLLLAPANCDLGRLVPSTALSSSQRRSPAIFLSMSGFSMFSRRCQCGLHCWCWLGIILVDGWSTRSRDIRPIPSWRRRQCAERTPRTTDVRYLDTVYRLAVCCHWVWFIIACLVMIDERRL